MKRAKYIFPKTKFADTNTDQKQLAHMLTEYKEVLEAFVNEDPKSLAMEVCDLIHSGETFLRIVAKLHKLNIAEIQTAVIEKNRVRGHYGS